MSVEKWIPFWLQANQMNEILFKMDVISAASVYMGKYFLDVRHLCVCKRIGGEQCEEKSNQ